MTEQGRTAAMSASNETVALLAHWAGRDRPALEDRTLRVYAELRQFAIRTRQGAAKGNSNEDSSDRCKWYGRQRGGEGAASTRSRGTGADSQTARAGQVIRCSGDCLG